MAWTEDSDPTRDVFGNIRFLDTDDTVFLDTDDVIWVDSIWLEDLDPLSKRINYSWTEDSNPSSSWTEDDDPSS